MHVEGRTCLRATLIGYIFTNIIVNLTFSKVFKFSKNYAFYHGELKNAGLGTMTYQNFQLSCESHWQVSRYLPHPVVCAYPIHGLANADDRWFKLIFVQFQSSLHRRLKTHSFTKSLRHHALPSYVSWTIWHHRILSCQPQHFPTGGSPGELSEELVT